MFFNSFADFIQMGTHGGYVWSAYGLGVCILLCLVIHSLNDRRKTRTQLRKRYLREQKR